MQERALTDRTKKIFADSLYHLSEKMPFEKIFVKEICQEAGLSRQSFYYHFKDKYDLIAWMFMQDFTPELKKNSHLNSVDMMTSMLRKLEAKHVFYKKAILDPNQNNLCDYIVKMYVEMEISALCAYLNTDELDSELVYEVKSYSYACIMHTREWFKGTELMSPERFAGRMYSAMPDILKKAYFNQ